MPIDAFSNPDKLRVVGPLAVVTDVNSSAKGSLSTDDGAFATDGAGNLTTTGQISAAGGIHATNGGLSVLAGTTQLLGSVLQLNDTASANIQAPTGAAQTITTSKVVNRTAPTGACTGAILAAGVQDGQVIIVTNESTVVANTITFSTTLATGLVLTDATPDAHVIKASSAAMFVWFTSLNGGSGAWVRVGPFGG